MPAHFPGRGKVATIRTPSLHLNIPSSIFTGRNSYQPICPICAKAVALETAKTDEVGTAIHDRCYLLKLKLKQASSYDDAA
jgi:hypothetical protein